MRYGSSALKNAPGFDGQLHSHLLDLRNRLVAHGDYALLPSTMYVQTLADEILPVSIGVHVKMLAGIGSAALAERYQAHFHACVNALMETLNIELRELAGEARKYPDVFAATNNLATDVREYQAATQFGALPDPTGPAADVAEPSFPQELSEYRYTLFRHELPLIENGSTHTVHVDGQRTEVTFEVGGDGGLSADNAGD